MLRTQASSLLRAVPRQQQAMVLRRAATTHAISNPTLANIEKRWESMPLQEQAELWMSLRDRMKGPWNELTLQEKKAAYWIAFGPHGPRAQAPPGEGSRVFFGTAIAVGASLALFGTTRLFAGSPPPTMNKEWQEAANEKLVEQRSDPLTGISSDFYTGKGQVQSPPKQ
ncbi:cytochrome c oxidase polypeptide V [Plectosphaerella cucumerina]|uniref:Cytochrome c oxidase polypeptide V n=1 Tax=Plectosphaerella cucumerina TaxID=40658 RepID=A0A8K0TP33_9PEZI|nr:cytochrome c oxidase polypeptide V [Plectosphaerella cucumerina]